MNLSFVVPSVRWGNVGHTFGLFNCIVSRVFYDRYLFCDFKVFYGACKTCFWVFYSIPGDCWVIPICFLHQTFDVLFLGVLFLCYSMPF